MTQNSKILTLVDRLAGTDPSVLIANLYAPLLGPVAGHKLAANAASSETLLEEIAAELPATSKACINKIAKLAPNTQQRIVLLRAAILRVTDNPAYLHLRLLVFLNELANAGNASARAACIFHAQLGMNGTSTAYLQPLAVLARELSSISTRDALAYALKAIELGGARLVRDTVIKAAKRCAFDLPKEHGGIADLLFLKELAGKYRIPFAENFTISTANDISRSTRFDVIPAEKRAWTVPKGDSDYYRFREGARPHKVPPISVHALEDGIVSFDLTQRSRPQSYIFDADGNTLRNFANGATPFIVDEPIEVEGDLGILSDRFCGPMNICHFLLDHFSRVHLYKSVSSESFFLSGNDYPYYREIARLAGIGSKFVWPGKKRFSIRASRLLVSDNLKPTFQHPAHSVSKWATDFLRQSLLPRAPGGGRCIFISREDAKSRIILNWPEVAPILEEYGYEVLRLADLPVAEQIETFASAAYVVGVHGAGLTNLLFAPIGTHVLEIFPALRATGAFWKLSSGLGHDYHALIADDPEFPRPDYATYRSAPGQKSPNVILPPEKLRKALEALHAAGNAS